MTDLRLVPMTAERFPAFVDHSRQGFARQQVESGTAGPAEAGRHAQEQIRRLLPHGLETPGQHLWTVHDGPDEVGHLWLHVRAQDGGPAGAKEAFVYDVEVHAQARGRGLGRATMLAAEAEARRLGATTIRLNVFGHNVAARRLYDGLGYEVTAALMRKPL